MNYNVRKKRRREKMTKKKNNVYLEKEKMSQSWKLNIKYPKSNAPQAERKLNLQCVHFTCMFSGAIARKRAPSQKLGKFTHKERRIMLMINPPYSPHAPADRKYITRRLISSHSYRRSQ